MSWTLREIFTAIVKEWGIQLEEDGKVINPDRAKLNQLEKAVLAESEGVLYIDDIQKATPEKIRRLRLWCLLANGCRKAPEILTTIRTTDRPSASTYQPVRVLSR